MTAPFEPSLRPASNGQNSPSAARIAIVDDDDSVRRALARLIAVESFVVQTHKSGHAFLEDLKLGLPDCLIADLQMDEMTGLELLHRLTGLGIRIPTIIVTAHDEPGTRHRCKLAGAVGFLVKPVMRDPLLEAIRAVVVWPDRAEGGRI